MGKDRATKKAPTTTIRPTGSGNFQDSIPDVAEETSSHAGSSPRYQGANRWQRERVSGKYGMAVVRLFTLNLLGLQATLEDGIKFPFTSKVRNKAGGEPIEELHKFEQMRNFPEARIDGEGRITSIKMGVGDKHDHSLTAEFYQAFHLKAWMRVRAIILVQAPEGLDINLRKPDNDEHIAILMATGMCTQQDEKARARLQELISVTRGADNHLGDYIATLTPAHDPKEQVPQGTRLIVIGSLFDREAQDYKESSDVEVRLPSHRILDGEGVDLGQGPDTVKISYNSGSFELLDRKVQCRELAEQYLADARAGNLNKKARSFAGSEPVDKVAA